MNIKVQSLGLYYHRIPLVKKANIVCANALRIDWLEMLLKHFLETKSTYGAYPHTHKLNKLLEALIGQSEFRTDKLKYFMPLQVITVCAEEYRYNFLIDCEGYRESVRIADMLLDELIQS